MANEISLLNLTLFAFLLMFLFSHLAVVKEIQDLSEKTALTSTPYLLNSPSEDSNKEKADKKLDTYNGAINKPDINLKDLEENSSSYIPYIFPKPKGTPVVLHFNETLYQEAKMKFSTYSSAQWKLELEIKLLHTIRVLGKRSYLIVSVVNYGMIEMALNWIVSLILQQYQDFLVLALDLESYLTLCSYGFGNHVANAQEQVGAIEGTGVEALKYGTKSYNELLSKKIELLMWLLNQKIRVILSDTDLVFLSPFVLEYILSEYPSKELVAMNDFSRNLSGFLELNLSFSDLYTD